MIFATGVSYAQMEWSAQSQISFGHHSNSSRTGVQMRLRDYVLSGGVRLGLPKGQTISGPNSNGSVSPGDWSEVPGYYVQLGFPLLLTPDSGWSVYALFDFERYKGSYVHSWVEADTAGIYSNTKVPYQATILSDFFAINLHVLNEYRLNERNYIFAGLQIGQSKYRNENNNWVRSDMYNFAFYFGYRYRFARIESLQHFN